MENEQNNKSTNLEEEIKKWQEVYPIEEGIVVDLRRETEIDYQGNSVLLNDDPTKEANTRKAKSSTTNHEIIEVEVKEVQDKIKDFRALTQQQDNKPKLK